MKQEMTRTQAGRWDSPRLGAEAVPGQLEQLKAQAEKNRVLLTDGPHQNPEEDRLTDTRRTVKKSGCNTFTGFKKTNCSLCEGLKQLCTSN